MKKKILQSFAVLTVISIASLWGAQKVHAEGWETVGDGGISMGQADYISLAVNPTSGEPYVTYEEHLGDSLNSKVMRYTSGSWQTLSGDSFNDNFTAFHSLAFNANNGELYLAYGDYSNSDGYKATVKTYGEGSWQSVGEKRFSEGAIHDISFAINPQTNEPYVAFNDNVHSSKVTVMKYSSGMWQVVGSSGFTNDQNDGMGKPSLAINPLTGEPYVAYSYHDNSSWNAKVMKFSDDSWISVGDRTFDLGGNNTISLAFKPNSSEPYLAFCDNSNSQKATVMKFSGESWQAVGNPGLGVGGAGLISLAFNPIDKEPYVAHTDGQIPGATVMKYTNNAWQTVGSAGFSPTTLRYLSLVFNPNNGQPYVAFDNYYNSSKAMVMKYVGEASPIILKEDFEDFLLDSRISIGTVDGNTNWGIKDSTFFGSSKALGFGRSACGANCFGDHATTLTITLPEPTYVSELSFKDMELFENWGSDGRIYIDGQPYNKPDVGVNDFWGTFGRLPYNDRTADTSYRDNTIPINKVVTTIELQSWDITNLSELFIDDLVVKGGSSVPPSGDNHAPVLSFSSDDGFKDDYINPDKGTVETEFQFKVVYTDEDNDAPEYMKTVVLGNSYNLTLDTTASQELHDGNYANGEQYVLNKKFNKKKNYGYFFEASDGQGGKTEAPNGSELFFDVNNVPVIIVPGIAGSELFYAKNNDQIWTPDGLLDPFYLKNALSLNENGEEKSGYDLDARSLVDGSFDGLTRIFTDKIRKYKYQIGIDLFILPYDWRKSLRDPADLLDEKIKDIRGEYTNTGVDKVNIIAHSMGGLVAKKYIKEHNGGNIGKLVFVGTPNLGAPKAFLTLMYGDFFMTWWEKYEKVLTENVLKHIAITLPSMYELLPTQRYGSYLGSKSYEETFQYLEQHIEGDQAYLIDNAKNDGIEDVQPISYGVKTFNITGCHVPTFYKFHFRTTTVKGHPSITNLYREPGSGDGTVPDTSSKEINSNGNQFFVKDGVHRELPSAPQVPWLIGDILDESLDDSVYRDDSVNIKMGMNDSSLKDFCGITGQGVSVHSPIDLHIYDEAGNHVGPNEDGGIDRNIPGVSYDIIDHNKFAFLPEGITYKVVGKATDVGEFDMEIERVERDEIVSNTYYNEVPLENTNTSFEATISDSQAGNVKFDKDGDGTLESDLQPSALLNAEEARDLTPPETKAEITGTKGNNDWYKSDVQVKLNATDDNSGILKTEYSVDDGQTWNEYGSPLGITNEGTTKVIFYSIDRAGNYEEPKTQEIKIDKTAPKIIINTPGDGAEYILKSVTNADWSVTDGISGIEKTTGTIASGSPIDTGSVGSKDFAVTATDLAGNSDTKTVKYDVAYAFGGFQNPTAKDNKTFNSSSTIPVKFQLTDASGGYISNAVANLMIDEKEAVASGNSNDGNKFRYDANQYIFNLSLKNTSLGAGTHTLKIVLDDGTVHSLPITIK